MLSQQTQFSGPQWYAVHTKPKEEDRAADNLTAWGVEIFAPKIRERRLNQFTSRATLISKPLFPGYIFARFDATTSLHEVNCTRGINRVVSFGDRPAQVDDQVIDMIRARTNMDGFIQLAPGMSVTIKEGPLKGLVGVLEREMKDSERVMLLLTCVSFQGHFVIERECLSRVIA